MAKVVFSPIARQDAMEAVDYIGFKLQNKPSARKLMDRIQKALVTLGQFPESGTPLTYPGIASVYRYLMCGNYMMFYHISKETVYIDRVLYGRRDYLSILFGEEISEDNE